MTAKYLCRYCAEPIELHQGCEDIPALGAVHTACARQREFALEEGRNQCYPEVAIHRDTGQHYGPFPSNEAAVAWVERVDPRGTWDFEDVMPPYEPRK